MARFGSMISLCVFALVACGVPAMDTRLISHSPADAQSYAVAQRAVRACTQVTLPKTVLASFEREGFSVYRSQGTGGRGQSFKRYDIRSPDPDVIVLYAEENCWVGLKGMTPAQSAALARIWVDAHQARPNSDFGDGLSDHVSGAWRRFFTEPAQPPAKPAYHHKIYISAYKSWPSGPYDPQRNIAYSVDGVFPDVPGAAVRLFHTVECQPHVKTGPSSGAFLLCSGPDYVPE